MLDLRDSFFKKKHGKFMADLKNGKRIQQKVVGILGNCIWIDNGKLSLLLRVYS